MGRCICNNVFEPTSILKVFPIFSKVPPLFLCQAASGDNILVLPIFIPPLLPVFAPSLAAILNPPLATCDAPAAIPPAIKPSAKPSTAAFADFWTTVAKLSPDTAERTAVVAALVPADIAPATQAALTPATSAGSAAPPVRAVTPTPIAIAAAPIAILASHDNCPSSSLSFTGLLLQ